MENVTKVFRTGQVETSVLRGVDIEVQSGEYVSIVGPSGCGKSTLLAIMGLMDTPTDGIYCFDGKPAQKLSASERARIRNHDIGFVFQSFNLIGDLNVFENVEQPLAYQRMKASERKDRVSEALKKVGMTEHAKRRPSQLSGGQQQRVAVARALVVKPRILLADEPTGNLDSTNGYAIMEMLRELHQGGATICMVTHDPRFVHMADRLVYMSDGRMVGNVPVM
jgi:putative ABC transport system ATP-binding protein